MHIMVISKLEFNIQNFVILMQIQIKTLEVIYIYIYTYIYIYILEFKGLSTILLVLKSIQLIQFLWQSDTTYFSSSDWSTVEFLITDVTNML